MALTVAEVTHPNSTTTDMHIPPFRGKVVDVTFDSSYLTTGELLTAAALGWNQVFGAVALTHASNSDGTLGMPVVVKASADNSELTLQPLESAGDGDPMDEAGSTNDLSTFTVRLWVLGS